ncbi:HutD/Ves family protein [Sphingomonas sp. PB4P5]|uniref:HutD/Ves family protein n=1 Tax=Parasphingomonas puruogangriensis TaxID=3096155 RepID=UPI002FC5B6CF
MRLLRARDRVGVSWRNGAGSTQEVLCVGADVGFDWRVSVATIDRDAAFSRFDGCDRTLLLARGGPVTLAMTGREVVLCAGDVLTFAGEDAVAARVAAPALALNVMTRRENFVHAVERIVVDGEIFLAATMIIALGDGLSFASVALDPFDAIMLDGAAATLQGSGAALAIRIARSQ